jgi:hypothetical protein
LLAADSLGIKKVKQYGLFRLFGDLLGLGQIIQPTDIQGHDTPPCGAGFTHHWLKHNHFPVKDKRASSGLPKVG